MKKVYKIGIIPGDGIGRDVIRAALIVLEAVNKSAEAFELDFVKMDTGETAVAKYGNPFPKETSERMAQTDTVSRTKSLAFVPPDVSSTRVISIPSGKNGERVPASRPSGETSSASKKSFSTAIPSGAG